MTQKERILVELIRVPDGLTAVELVDRTGLPVGSLRTTLWALRKEGLIEVVGGVRGRYRYGVTGDGKDALAQSSRSPMGPGEGSPQAALFDSVALGDFRHDHRTLRGFVRWLAREHTHLFAELDQPALRQQLDELVMEYLEQDYDPVRQMFRRALWDSREKGRDED